MANTVLVGESVLKIVNKISDNDMKVVNYIYNYFSREGYYSTIRHIEGIKDFSLLGSGSCGCVFGFGDYVIKINSESNYGEISRDGDVLSDLQGLPFIPKLYIHDLDNRFMVIQKIEGEIAKDSERIDLDIDKLKEQIPYIESSYCEAKNLGWTWDDIHHKNIMVDLDSNVWIVDVGLFRKEDEIFWSDGKDDMKGLIKQMIKKQEENHENIIDIMLDF